jgi:glycolate oxidase iron-sulfur subunit
VNFHRLADIGRERLDGYDLRPWWDRWRRRSMARFFAGGPAFRGAVAVARVFRGLMPSSIRRQLPRNREEKWPPDASGSRRQLLLHEGCVQPTLAPSINAAAARVLHRRDIGARPAKGCCGALAYHLDDVARARRQIRSNIDAWLPAVEAGEGLVVTASGCAAFIRDYGRLCQDDPQYAERGARLSSGLRDVCDFLEPTPPRDGVPGPEVILHVPCTLKNALRGEERLRSLLTESGWRLARTSDDGQCCGSAGAYSLLHPKTSRRLLHQKLAGFDSEHSAQEIVTANLGCGMHLARGTSRPVRHWLEVWDRLEA